MEGSISSSGKWVDDVLIQAKLHKALKERLKSGTSEELSSYGGSKEFNY